MSHTEADRKAFYRDTTIIERKEAIAKWLSDNPDIGTLNGDRFYIIINGETRYIEPLSEIIGNTMRTQKTINEARKASKRGRKQAIIEISEYTSFLTTATGMSRRGDRAMMTLFANKHPEVLS